MKKIPYNVIKHGIIEYPNCLSKDACNEIINVFEQNPLLHQDRIDFDNSLPWLKQDTQVISKSPDKNPFLRYVDPTYKKIIKAYKQYSLHFGELSDYIEDTIVDDFKVQRTLPGEGYHTWHFEQFPLTPNRVAVWAIYLNDINKGGETEFLYQHVRVKPKQGSLLIFPANYIFTHRGNPPLEKTKYIITGWFTFTPPYNK